MKEIRGLVIPKNTKDSLNNIIALAGYTTISITPNDIVNILARNQSSIEFIDTQYTLLSLPPEANWRLFNNLENYKVLSQIYIRNRSNVNIIIDLIAQPDTSGGDQQNTIDALNGIADAITANKDIEINIVRDSGTPARDFIQILTLDYSTNPPTPNPPIYRTMDFLTPVNPPVMPINRISDTIYTHEKETVIANKTVVGSYAKNDELTKITFYYGKVRQETIWYNETNNWVITGQVPRSDYVYPAQFDENWSTEFITVKKAEVFTVLSSWFTAVNINDTVVKITNFSSGVKNINWYKITDNSVDILDGITNANPNVLSIPGPTLNSEILKDDNFFEKTIYKLEHRKNEFNSVEQERNHYYHSSLNVFGLYKGTSKWVVV